MCPRMLRQAVLEGVSHFCMNSSIDLIPHCIQHLWGRDKDGETHRGKERECVQVLVKRNRRGDVSAGATE